MEPWALAVLGSALVLAGAILGGLAVFAVGLRMHRRRCQKLHIQAPVAAEDLEAQAGDPAKHAQKEAACWPLPDPALCRPAPSPIDSPTAPTAPTAHSTSPSPPATPPVRPEISNALHTQSCHAVAGLGVLTPAASFPADRSADWSAQSKSRSTCSSAATAVAKALQRPAAAHLPPLQSPRLSTAASSPARRPAALATRAAASGVCNPSTPTDVYSSSRLADRPSPKSEPESIDENNLDTISPAVTPATPCMIGSPCDSVDYVDVPPSPSIASLYGMSTPGSPVCLPPVLSPRSARLGRSLASPARAIGPSMFSPPPATYHRRYFDADRRHL
ncbi:hypothetical protein H4R19_001491 [Coemansia spiralis]|nr:hypothetical protein H4R19_001491 [Coemansia spiralis]